MKNLFVLVLFLAGMTGIALPQIVYAQWSSIEGPYGGGISGIVADSSGNFYACSGIDLLKTDDIGEGWETIQTSADIHRCILITPEEVLFVSTNSGAIRSYDGGNTWEDASNGLVGTITSMVQLPGGRIVCISQLQTDDQYICITDDLGSNWSSAPHENNIYYNLMTDTATGYVSYISSGDLYRSADGINWDTTELPNYITYHQDFYVDRQGRLYIAYGDNTYPPFWYVVRSSDYGATWQQLLYVGSGGEDQPMSLTQIDNGDLIVIVNDTTFRRSTDDGLTWQTAGTGVPGMSVEYMYDVPGDTICGQSNHGLYYSPDNGYTWLWGSNGITPNSISQMAVSESGVILASTDGGSGLWRSPDNGLSWEDARQEIPNFDQCQKIMYSGNHFWVYYATNSHYRFARYDGNGQWEVLFHPGWPNCFSARADGDTYMGDLNGLSKSEDFGDTWTVLTGSVFPDVYVRGVKCLSSGTVLCLVGSGLAGFEPYYIYRSTDDGNTWTAVFEPFFGANNYNYSIDFHTNGIGDIYFGVPQNSTYGNPAYYYTSNDDGLTWTLVNLPDSFEITSLYTDAANGLYVISENVLYKTDKGAIWVPDMEGLPENAPPFALVEAEYNNIYMRMTSHGIFKKSVPVDTKKPLPLSSSFTVYPNPAASTITIQYTGINNPEDIILQLHDITGKCLREIRLRAGNTILDLTDIAPGTYFLKGEGVVSKLVKF